MDDNEDPIMFSQQSHLLFFRKAIVTYMVMFGTRYISSDIKMYCGDLMDNYIVKIFTLFCIMYQSTKSFEAAVVMTLFFTVFHMYHSSIPGCNITNKSTSRD